MMRSDTSNPLDTVRMMYPVLSFSGDDANPEQDFDLHLHSTFSDGLDDPETMILAAIDARLHRVGFSDHTYTPFDPDYCMHPDRYDEYVCTIRRLADRYRDRIEVLCGMEVDADSAGLDYKQLYDLDYTIGSVHYMKKGDEFLCADLSAESLRQAAAKYYNGDLLSLAELYYEACGNVINRTGADIIGHFDLITKFQETCPLFDTASPRYRAAWMRAADALLASGRPFEINTGAMSRGYRTSPYPSSGIVTYLREKGAHFLYSSDAHSASAIAFGFRPAGNIAQK